GASVFLRSIMTDRAVPLWGPGSPGPQRGTLGSRHRPTRLRRHDEGDGGVQDQADGEDGRHLDDDRPGRLDVLSLELLPLRGREVGPLAGGGCRLVVAVAVCVRVRHGSIFLTSGGAMEATPSV